MLFYSCDINLLEEINEDELRSSVRAYSGREYTVVLYKAKTDVLSVCVITKIPLHDMSAVIKTCLKRWKISSSFAIDVMEINMDQLGDRLFLAEKERFILSARYIFRRYALLALYECRMYSEGTIYIPDQSDSDMALSRAMFLKDASNDRCQYIIKSSDSAGNVEAIKAIVEKHNSRRRITSYTFGLVDFYGFINYVDGSFADLLFCCINRTLIVQIPCCDKRTRDGRQTIKAIEGFLSCLNSCKSFIQVIFIDAHNDDLLESLIDKNMPCTPLGVVSASYEVTYRNLSDGDCPEIDSPEIQPDTGGSEKRLLSSMELEDQKPRKQKKAAPKHENNAVDYYQELMGIIGLEEAKRIADLVINYDLASKTLADKGFKRGSISMHMAFLGNPGTAKTTVARMMAAAFKQKGVLRTGNFVEVGRGDLVGKYVGHTADIVKRRFEEARGGVLFIDEAYSLLGDMKSFGGEAINTIVQEMENHRNDTLVIFAGYPDLMEEFIDSNPGLRSRVQFKVPFPDYTTEELCRIADYLADKLGVKLDDEAHIKLKELLESARESKDFGNGRFVRNIIEQAKLEQANRLMSDAEKIQSLTEDDIKTITATDLVFETKLAQKKKYGFV